MISASVSSTVFAPSMNSTTSETMLSLLNDGVIFWISAFLFRVFSSTTGNTLGGIVAIFNPSERDNFMISFSPIPVFVATNSSFHSRSKQFVTRLALWRAANRGAKSLPEVVAGIIIMAGAWALTSSDSAVE